MTGIERLRELANHIDTCNTSVFIGNAVRDIADQIERETMLRPVLEGGRAMTNWEYMFGTPGRTAETLSMMKGICRDCPVADICLSGRVGCADSLLKWLTADDGDDDEEAGR